MVDKSGVLQIGNNVFDAKIIPMVGSKKKNFLEGNNLKSFPKFF